MKTFNKYLLFTLFFVSLVAIDSVGQTGVLNPNDPIVVYNPSSPPSLPPANTLAKWVKTNRISWNSTSLKCYYFNGIPFRLKFPKSYVPGNGVKYPLYLFFHGVGEKGTVYDNEFQLFHGGQTHVSAVDNNKFDGFLLYPQSTSASGGWNNAQLDNLATLITNFLIPQVQVDPFRICVNGLSGGGGATWNFMARHPQLTAADISMSGAAIGHINDVKNVIYNQFWIVNGGLDRSPSPYTVDQVLNECVNQGANYSHKLYPNIGHGVWNTFWAEPSYFPYMVNAHKANPWVRYGRSEFCPGDSINVTIGVTAGFNNYEWRKNGVLISGANSNTIQVNSVGVYDCRILRGTEWSVWSPKPVEIKLKTSTISPDISVNGLFSNVLPSLDGKTSVDLFVPIGYTSYLWQKMNPTTILPNTGNIVTGAAIGTYQVKVTEQYGCTSNFSNIFTVIDANGPNGPSDPTNLSAFALSQTQIKLNWNLDPSPSFMETGFEIYQSTSSDGPFKLIAKATSRIDSFIVTELSPKTRYYYKIRAINNNAGSSATLVASAITFSDNTRPTPPGNLRTSNVTQSGITLLWDESTDQSGIYKYDIYINGHVSYTIDGDQTQFSVNNLVNSQYYRFIVKGRDIAGNESLPSNQVVAAAAFSGLNYKHYIFTGTWNSLPDFNTITPVAEGNDANVSITNRVQNDNFAYLWEGFINIPVSGTYYFGTASDDGSRLWLGSLNGSSSPYSFSGTPIVNNDGLHGTQTRTSAAQNLTAGTYPIAIAFYEQGGGESMSISWRTPSTGTSYVSIPNSAFVQTVPPPGAVPDAPSLFTATVVSAKKIDLTWQDNSSDETGFEIFRSTSANSGFSIVGTVTAETTNYSDSSLAPETTYYYKIQAINLNGASTLIPAFVGYQARWQFNNDYSDASGNNKVISGSNGPTFSTDMQEGAHSINLDGSNDFINVNSSSGDFLRGGYTAKTVAFWMKADQTNSNRGIFDFGGSDDGLAMRLNSNQLYAGIASNNTRRSLSVTYTSTSWNHIALVYNVNEIRLYVNGVSVAENTNLGFNSVTVTSDGSRIGDDNTSNALTTSFGVFDGKFDDFMIIGSALTATEINQIISHSYGAVTATTLSLPLLPSEPTNLAAIVESSSKINLTWTDNATTISYYEVWRSAFNNSNFELVKTLSGANSSYSDNSLTDNTMYYYKVRAVNEAGNSNYSNETSAATLINPTTIVSLSAIPSFEIVNDTTFVLNMTATSNLGTTITYSSNNLPSFAQIITNPDNTGLLKFSANSHDLGKYNLSVTATDNFGGSDTKSFVLNVLGKNQTVINLNFNQSLPQSLPWNNTNSAPVANLTLNSLKDNNNNNTSVGFKLLNSMVGSYSNAVTTGNNSGVYPDNVLKTMYFSSSNTPIQFNLTGLSSSKKYSLIIHAGYPWTPQQQATTGTLIGVYSAGAESATLDAANNTSNIVRLNALSPNASGIITVNMQKAPGAGYLIINAMQIVSYDDSQASITFNAPFNVKATGTSSDMIKLNWQNPSESRTGIEIWRSTSPNGSYILRSTVGPNDLTYSDNGLTSGATYFYKLRSVNNLIFSNYSEPVGASTVSYVIKLNLNSQETLSQASPWNNLNTLTYSGFTFENMVNTNSQPTGVNFGVIDNFTSFHDGVGISTGNNSGVVPDNVMKTLYYVAGGDVANFTLSGLNRTHIYNIEFYAGSVFNYPSLSDYQIGDEIVQLNGLNNTTQTVRINNVKPDSTGTIHVRFSTTSMYAFLNALIIHGMPSPEIVALDSVNASGNSNQNGRMIYVSEIVESENAGVTAATTVVPDKLQQKNALEVAPEFSGDVQAYPNPFEDRINLRFNFKQDVPKFTIILTDMSGRQVLRNEFGKVYSGVWQQTLELNKKLPVGIYMLHIIGLPDEKPKVLKLLKSTSF